jgi:hypothetical protein
MTSTAVPPLDVTDPAVVADPYPGFARARAIAPVQWHEGLRLWLAFTHAESNAVLRDRRLGRIWRDKEPAERFESLTSSIATRSWRWSRRTTPGYAG